MRARTSSSERLVRLASSVILLYVMLVPIASLVGSGGFDISDIIGGITIPDTPSGDGAYTEVAKEAFVSGIKELVSEKYGIAKSDISVLVYGFDFESMRAEKIKIALSGKGALSDWRSIASYITGEGLGKCEVNIVIG